MQGKFFVIGLFLFSFILAGCVGQSSGDVGVVNDNDAAQGEPVVAPQAGDSGAPETPEPEVQPETQNQAPATAGSKLTVHSYEFASAIGSGSTSLKSGDGEKFVVINVTAKNTGSASIKPFSKFKIYSSQMDIVFGCRLDAINLMPGAFTNEDLAPGAARTGLIACFITRDAHTVKLVFDGEEAEIYEYTDVVDSLKTSGAVGSFVGNRYAGTLVKVNSFEFVNGVTNSEGKTTYGGASEQDVNGCYTDRQKFGKGPGQASWSCSLVIVDLTVKNKVNVPWSTSFGLSRFQLKIGSPGQEVARNYHAKFFEVLSNPLNLVDVAYGEERSGQLIYAVGDGIPTSSVPVVFTREDVIRFGTTDVTLKSG
ncbi:MAG: DUF4352 domain-containing protein [Candidatus Micrarchaeota archaeon]